MTYQETLKEIAAQLETVAHAITKALDVGMCFLEQEEATRNQTIVISTATSLFVAIGAVASHLQDIRMLLEEMEDENGNQE